MGENSNIEWTHHTFNPWIGCTKVSVGCAHCYAEADMATRRKRVVWGAKGTRVRTTNQYWSKPVKWDTDAFQAGENRRVFCASLADVFEKWEWPIQNASGSTLSRCRDCRGIGQNFDDDSCEFCGSDEVPGLTTHDLRSDLFDLIDVTPRLDWLLLTKRPERILETICPNEDPDEPEGVSQYYRQNTWLGTSISDQATADDAVPSLLTARELSPVLFLSVEPLLGPVDLTPWLRGNHDSPSIDWVIVGGESGHGARQCQIEWIRDVIQQCRIAGVACFIKQLGALAIHNGNSGDARAILNIKHKKGGDILEWPDDLRLRQFPIVNRKGN